MISKYSHKALNWIDLESPNQEEINHILEECSIPEYIKQGLLIESSEAKIDINTDYIFISLEVPHIFLDKNRMILVANDDLVLTIHDEPIKAFDQFSKELELDIVSQEKINNNKLLFTHLLKNLHLHLNTQLLDSKIQINHLEKQIIKNKKKLKLLKIFSFILLGVIILTSIYVISHI